MSISLTWANYALIVSACLIVYYFIVLLFYRKKFNLSVAESADSKGVLSHFSSDEKVDVRPKNRNLFGEEVEDEEVTSIDEDRTFSPDAQDFADEIAAYTFSCGDNIEKEELLLNLRKIIQKYPSLAESNAQYELSQLIAISTENYCSIHVSADELGELWKN